MSIPIIVPENRVCYGLDYQNTPRLVIPKKSAGQHFPARTIKILGRQISIDNTAENGIIYSEGGRPIGRAILSGNRLQVEGLQAGEAIIKLRTSSSTFVIRLTVKDVLIVPTIAHFVQHGPFHRTRMDESKLNEIIREANAILEPQANVKIVLKDAQPLSFRTIGKTLGRTVVSSKNKSEDERQALITHTIRITQRHGLNLFLVRRYEIEDFPDGPRHERRTQDRELAGTAEGICILEDHIKHGKLHLRSAGNTLAHEVSHHLGVETHNVPNHSYLMYESGTVGGRMGERIEPHHADRMNRSGLEIVTPP